MGRCQHYYDPVRCENETRELWYAPGHFLAYCDAHEAGNPCAIEGCGIQRKKLMVDALGLLRDFYVDIDPIANVIEDPYCHKHSPLFWTEWSFCWGDECRHWVHAKESAACAEHGGKDYQPKTKVP